MKAHQKIRAAMLANERAVLAYIRRYGSMETRVGDFTSAWMRATNRLEVAGRIKYLTAKRIYVINDTRKQTRKRARKPTPS